MQCGAACIITLNPLQLAHFSLETPLRPNKIEKHEQFSHESTFSAHYTMSSFEDGREKCFSSLITLLTEQIAFARAPIDFDLRTILSLSVCECQNMNETVLPGNNSKNQLSRHPTRWTVDLMIHRSSPTGTGATCAINGLTGAIFLIFKGLLSTRIHATSMLNLAHQCLLLE